MSREPREGDAAEQAMISTRKRTKDEGNGSEYSEKELFLGVIFAKPKILARDVMWCLGTG